jgi:putative oxidoreductase
MMDLALFVLRLAVGLTVTAHGAQKLFGSFGGPGVEGFSGFLGSLGFRRARAYAVLTGCAEFFGGLALALGLFTPVAVAAVIGVMLTATLVVHASNGFFAANGGYEFPALLAVAAAAIALAGPGAYSLDNALDLGLATEGWAAAGIAVGVLAAIVAAIAQRSEARRTQRAGGMRTA